MTGRDFQCGAGKSVMAVFNETDYLTPTRDTQTFVFYNPDDS